MVVPARLRAYVHSVKFENWDNHRSKHSSTHIVNCRSFLDVEDQRMPPWLQHLVVTRAQITQTPHTGTALVSI